jgi:hypothetical protein
MSSQILPPISCYTNSGWSQSLVEILNKLSSHLLYLRSLDIKIDAPWPFPNKFIKL